MENWTKNTTFLKWFLGSIHNILITVIGIIGNVVLYYNWDGDLVALICVGLIINAALIGNIIGSVLMWKKEADKLK